MSRKMNRISINLNNPSHKACSHWTDFAHLIPATVQDLICKLPSSVTSVVEPNCAVSAILTGLLLGDGSINKGIKQNSRFVLKLAASERSLAFIAATAMFLELIEQGDGFIHLYQRPTGRWEVVCNSKRGLIWSKARLFWYPNNDKVIPNQIAHMLSDLGIALWIMGDGGRTGSGPSSGTELNTHSFSKDSLLLLCQALNDRYSMNLFLATGPLLSKGQRSYLITARVGDARKMRDIFGPLMHHSWHYKFPPLNNS